MKTTNGGGWGWGGGEGLGGCHIVVLENTLQGLTENATSGVFPLQVVNQRGTAKPLLLHGSFSFW